MYEVRAEMDASVWRVLVSEGDAVSRGDAIVVLEVMKMEIPVETHLAGVVTSLAVREGDLVRKGGLLAVVSSAEV